MTIAYDSKKSWGAVVRCREFVMDGVQHEFALWANRKGQIYLSDETVVLTAQRRIGKKKPL
ncbi:MAG: hypothetical protein NPIRA03_28750 [Nitrospirales bacterium]|nr:MAG: hypothetical protein NPIRA03_28750 [Nitrospirales bacterium]